jgi:hypothetical protein
VGGPAQEDMSELGVKVMAESSVRV